MATRPCPSCEGQGRVDQYKPLLPPNPYPELPGNHIEQASSSLQNFKYLSTRDKQIVKGFVDILIKVAISLMMFSELTNTNGQHSPDISRFRHNKQIPAIIEKNVLTALSFYPELKDASINFIFKEDIKTSVMQAQPVFTTLLRKKKNRLYRINISQDFRLVHSRIPIDQIPDDVMIGWIGHELGHILDYEGKSNTEMARFGLGYYFSPRFVKQAERVADSLAVDHGMGKYIISTKRFILDNADLPQAYKDKISRLYLSPDVIVELVRKLEEKKLKQEKKD